METRKFYEARLWSLECPELEFLIRNAPPAKQRHFAFACVRLAVSNTMLEGPIVDEAIEAAVQVLKGQCDTTDPRVVAAREAAWEWMRKLDDRQLTICEEIEADKERIEAETGRDMTSPHPRNDEKYAAINRFCTATALAYVLHDDAIEAAAHCAYELLAGLQIDLATLLAIGRDTLR